MPQVKQHFEHLHRQHKSQTPIFIFSTIRAHSQISNSHCPFEFFIFYSHSVILIDSSVSFFIVVLTALMLLQRICLIVSNSVRPPQNTYTVAYQTFSYTDQVHCNVFASSGQIALTTIFSWKRYFRVIEFT